MSTNAIEIAQPSATAMNPLCSQRWHGDRGNMKIFSRFMSWIKSGRNYWLVIVPFVISITSAFILREYTWGLDAFRLIGIVFEILGLLTVVWSLSRESKKYNHTGYVKSFFNWITEFRYIFIVRKGVFEVAGVTCGASIGGAALIASGHNFNSEEEKVEYLLKRVVELESAIDEGRKLTERVRNELSAQISDAKTSISSEIGAIKSELKEKATLDYYMLISGAWLTALGMIMTNFPDNISKKLLF